MVYQGRYAIGGWRHTKGRWQWSVEFWIEDVEEFACERASHSPTAGFRMSTRAWGYICKGEVGLEESWERRPKSQDMARSLRSRCWRLVWMCFRQVSWRSRCNPRYLTSCLTGIGVVCRNTGGQVTRRVLKVTCADFAGLTRIFHSVNQLWRRVKWLWRHWDATVNVSNVPGKHEVTENSHIGHCTHTAESTNVKVQ